MNRPGHPAFPVFSTVWKNFGRFFHGMEKISAVFPQYGKSGPVFSTVWKTFFHRVENPLRQPAAALAAGFLLAGAAAAPAAPVQLTVGRGWAWVRETFPPSAERDLERFVWSNPPPQVQLDTLQVWNVRRPWPVQEWRWLEPPPPAPPPAGQPLVWKPRPDNDPVHGKTLEIRLAEPLSVAMGHSLTYRLPGFDWRAYYRLTVRGIGPESVDAVQVDLTGYLRIENKTGAAFPEALVSWTGVDDATLPPPKPFGLLDLNPDTALTDLWLAPQNTEPPVPAAYPLQTPAAIPAEGTAGIQFAKVVRKPAQITHVCDSSEIPAPTPTGGLPLRRVLLIPNTAAMGLGFPLPPGQADLFLGAMRGAPSQSGRVLHTPFPGTLQLDMGPVETVRASRQAGEEIALPDGARQADMTITLVNNLASPVRIQIEEKPATPMQWSLVRTSSPCSESTRALHYDLTLPPQSAKTITYRLRLTARTRT